MTMRYNRRQRKKLRLGEFQEFGFSVQAAVRDPVDQGAVNALLDDFVECVEAHGLIVGGGVGEALHGFVTSGSAGEPVTDAKRGFVVDWLAGRTEFSKVDVGPLTDAWHGHA
jgi:uncharacterized protein YggL (DUF469 family)